MLKNNDVPSMMARVTVALAKGARARPAKSVVYITDATRDEIGISALRHPAQIQIEFHSGSARPGVGPAIQFGKRVMRRTARWYVQPIMEQQSRFNSAVLDVDDKLLAEHEKLVTEVSMLRDQADRVEGLVDALQAELADVRRSAVNPSAIAGGQAADDSDELSRSSQRMLKYSAFEDRHRGSDVDIRKLLTPYLPLFEGRTRVLDIGSGRGEFLELLKEAGVGAYGVDSDESMIETARARGVEAVLDDAGAHLRTLPAGSIDGVFCSQVAEHLTTNQLIQLIDICYRKLAPGGVIVMETPNPEALSIFASFFYVDLTHIKPVHPEALKWAFEAAGFSGVSIERSQPVPDGARLSAIPPDLADEPGWSAVAANVQRLNGLLYGPQHYAVVGYKPEELS